MEFSAKATTRHGPPIHIRCPHCHVADAPAATGAVQTTTHLFFFIPLHRATETLVKCGACSTVFRSKEPLEVLAGMTAEQIERRGVLRYRFDLVLACLPIIVDFLSAVFPVVNVLLPALMVYVVRKQPLFVRMIAWTGLAGAVILVAMTWRRQLEMFR